MATRKVINVGMIGSKFMGRVHSNAYLNVSKFFDLPIAPVMHSIVARDAKDLARFAPRWGWQHWTTDAQEMLANDEIGFVDVCTPNHLHKDFSIAALEAGKHVACEKPLAGTLADAREMLQAAKKAKKQKTFVWYNYRRCPALALAHQLVKQGKLGRIYHVRCCYLQDWGGPDTPMLWRFQGDTAGSGALGDLAAHSIDAARFITGDEVDEVNGAVLKTFITQREVLSEGSAKSKRRKTARSTVDDAAVFTASFKKGAVATFEATRLASGCKNENRIEVHGEKGALRFTFARMTELQWFDATLPSQVQGWSTIDVSDANAEHPYVGAWWPVGHNLGYEHGFVNQLADMMNMVADKKPLVPMPDFEDAYQTQRVLEAVTLSAKNRCAIKLSQVK